MPVKYIKRDHKIIGQVWTPDDKVGIGIIAGIVMGTLFGIYIVHWHLSRR